MEPVFPVFVVEKDSQDVARFDSLHDMQRHLERIDIENGEYEAWDSNGTRIQLGIQEPVWLTVTPAGGEAQEQLQKLLIAFGERLGVTIPSGQQSALAPTDLFDQIRSQAAARTQRGFFKRRPKKDRSP